MRKIEKGLVCFILILFCVLISVGKTEKDCEAKNFYRDVNEMSNTKDKNIHDIQGLFSCDNVDDDCKYSYEVELKMNDEWFFSDNTRFNKELCNTSIILSGLAYHKHPSDPEGSSNRRYDLEFNGEKHGIIDTMKYIGFNNVTEYNTNDYFSGDDQSEFDVGYKKANYNGKEQYIVLVSIRGTFGSLGEWSSNFDIGDTEEECDEWNTDTRYNHKGFDITTDRVNELLMKYLDQNHILKNDNMVFWITGHSRGGAIANVLSSKLQDKSYTTYAYTFASPNTTTKDSAKDYKGIFNIVNEDDIIPNLPLEGWGFTKYGKTATIDMTSDMQNEWDKNTGFLSYVDESKSGLDTTLDALTSIMKNRNDCKKYNFEAQGDNNKSIECEYSWADIYHHNLIMSDTPKKSLKYSKITQNDVGFQMYQTPMFFMQYLAAYMCDNISMELFVEFPVAPRYQSAKNRLIISGNPITGGLNHAHYVDSYYLIAKNVMEKDFK